MFAVTSWPLLKLAVLTVAVSENVQDQAGLGQEGQAEQTYPTVDQVQDG